MKKAKDQVAARVRYVYCGDSQFVQVRVERDWKFVGRITNEIDKMPRKAIIESMREAVAHAVDIERKVAIRALLTAKPGLDQEDIAEAFGWSLLEAHRLVTELRAEGKIGSCKGGK